MYPFFNSADRTCAECPRCTCSKHEATRIKSFATEADLEVVVVCKFYNYLFCKIYNFISLYSTDCYVTNQCNGTMVNFTKNSIDCCDGFAQGEPMEPEAGAAGESFGFFRRYKNRNSLRTEGCPVSK